MERGPVSPQPAEGGPVPRALRGESPGPAAGGRDAPGVLLHLRGTGRDPGYGADPVDGLCLYKPGLPRTAPDGTTGPEGEGAGPGGRVRRAVHQHGGDGTVREVRSGVHPLPEGLKRARQPDLPDGLLRLLRMGAGGRAGADRRVSGHPAPEGPLQRAVARMEKGNLRAADAGGLERGEPDAGTVLNHGVPGAGHLRGPRVRRAAGGRKLSLFQRGRGRKLGPDQRAVRGEEAGVYPAVGTGEAGPFPESGEKGTV